MKCNKCGSEWNSSVLTSNCPFCGASLSMLPQEKNIENILKYIVETQGIEIYERPSALIGLIGDLLPTSVDERRLIKHCLDAGVIKELLITNKKEQSEIIIVQKKVSKMLQDHYFLNKVMADNFVYWISYSLGIDYNISNVEQSEEPVTVTNTIQSGIKQCYTNETILKKRDAADKIEKRVIVGSNITLALNENGTVCSTEVLNDEYNIYGNCMDSATEWQDIIAINESYLSDHVIGVKKDGTVIVTKGKDGDLDTDRFAGSVVSSWTNVKEIIPNKRGGLLGDYTIYALTKDSKLLSAYKVRDDDERYYYGQNLVKKFSEVEKILGFYHRVICLKKDGTLCATEFTRSDVKDSSGWEKIKNWRNIKSLYYFSDRVIGLDKSGNLIATDRNLISNKYDFWYDIRNWKEIENVWGNKDELVALTHNGNILYCSSPEAANKPSVYKDMRTWENIVKVYWGIGVAAGLRTDGTVVVTNYYGEDDGWIWDQVSEWTDLIGLVPGYHRVVGIKSDGTLVHVGQNDHGEGNIGAFNLFAQKTPVATGNSNDYESKSNSVVALKTKIHESPRLRIFDVKSNNNEKQIHTNANLYSANKYFKNMNEKKQAFLQGIIAGGECYSVGIKSDKTVLSTKHNVKDFSNTVMISAGQKYIAGVQKDGRVYVTGKDASGFVKGFKNIKKVAVGHSHVVGLQQDGKVIAVNNNLWGQCEVDSWNNIVDISASTSYTLGLKSSGTVVIAGNDNPEISMGIKNWNNIIAVSAGGQHAMGLKIDGTVVSAGSNKEIRCDVSAWRNIIAISAGNRHYVGLKSDGTVVATGINDYGQCDVEDWKDIIAVAAGMLHTIGLKSDGTILLAGDGGGWLSHSKVRKWKLFNSIDEIESIYKESNC